MNYSIEVVGTVRFVDGRQQQTCTTYTVEEKTDMTPEKASALAFSSVEHVIHRAISTSEVADFQLKFVLKKQPLVKSPFQDS